MRKHRNNRDWRESTVGDWIEVQKFPGTGSMLTFDIPQSVPAGFYRVRRCLK